MSEGPRKRASRLKTKSGCITCKSRRVKCDETKPGCNRCLRLSGTCGGYEERVTLKGPPTRKPKKVKEAHSPRKLISKSLVPSDLRFESEEDIRYFQFFLENTAKTLSGVFRSNLWNEIVSQVSEKASFCKPAIIAIGALNRAGEALAVSLPGNRPHVDTSILREKGKFHHKYALQQYSLALRLMRESTAQSDYTLNLLSCLFTTCFEMFHGNLKSAQDLSSSGIRLFYDKQGIVEIGNTSSELDKKVEDTLIGLFDYLYKGHAFRSHGAQEFERQLLLHADAELKLNNMPKEFTSIIEARHYQDLMAKQVLLWTALKSFEYPTLTSISVLVFKNESPEIPENYLSLPKTLAAELEEEHNKAAALQKKWRAAFQLIFERSRTPAGNDDFLGANMLAIISITAPYNGIAGNLEAEVGLTSSPPASLSDVVSLAKAVLEHPDHGNNTRRATFTLDKGFVHALMLVANRSSAPAMRAQAIYLLEKYSRREGLWDSHITAEMATLFEKLKDRRQDEMLLGEISLLKAAGIKIRVSGRQPLNQSSKEAGCATKEIPVTTVIPAMVLKRTKWAEAKALSLL